MEHFLLLFRSEIGRKKKCTVTCSGRIVLGFPKFRASARQGKPHSLVRGAASCATAARGGVCRPLGFGFAQRQETAHIYLPPTSNLLNPTSFT